MPRVRVVTDSAADLPPGLAASAGITVIPLSVHFGQQTYIDGEDLSAARFYELLASDPTFPRTSQPAVGRFEQAYTQIRDEGAEVVSIHLSSKLSGTYNTASVAARSVEGLQAVVIDSLTASMAIGELALAAARLAAAGESAAEIGRQIETMRERVHVAIMLDSLTHVQRGGRIGRAQSLLGTLLSVKPILGVEAGEVVPRQRVRTTSKALQELAAEAGRMAPLAGMRIMHSTAPKLVAELLPQLQRLLPGHEIPVQLLGPVIGTHVGAGAIGVVILQEPAVPDTPHG